MRGLPTLHPLSHRAHIPAIEENAATCVMLLPREACLRLKV